MSLAPVTPSAALIAASAPASAAWPACSGLVWVSVRNACCNAAAKVPAVPIASANCVRSSFNTVATAAAAPNVPMVPVVCQNR